MAFIIEAYGFWNFFKLYKFWDIFIFRTSNQCKDKNWSTGKVKIILQIGKFSLISRIDEDMIAK